MRLVAGLFWGWVWSCLVIVAWIGLAALAIGDVYMMYEAMMGRPWAPYVLGASRASILGSFLGGLVGTLSMGNAPARIRRPVLVSSAAGAALGALIPAVAACVVVWADLRQGPRSTLYEWGIPGAALLGGALGGWLGGRVVQGHQRAMDDPGGDGC